MYDMQFPGKFVYIRSSILLYNLYCLPFDVLGLDSLLPVLIRLRGYSRSLRGRVVMTLKRDVFIFGERKQSLILHLSRFQNFNPQATLNMGRHQA